MQVLNQVALNLIRTGNEWEEERNYWLSKLGGLAEICGFEPMQPQDTVNGVLEGFFESRFDSPVSEKLLKTGGGSPFSVYLLLTAALGYLLYKYTGEQDVVLGMPPFAGEADDADLKGLFMLRSYMEDSDSFRNWLSAVQKTVNEAKKYKNLPFSAIRELLADDTAAEPLPLRLRTAAGMEGLHDDCYGGEETGVDIQFTFYISGETVGIRTAYHTTLYSESRVRDIVAHLMHLTAQCIYNPSLALSECDLFTPEQRERMELGNRTSRPYDRKLNVVELIEAESIRHPDQEAVTDGTLRYTYKQLNERANAIAEHLIHRGAAPGQRVGMLIPRSADTLAVQLGILKTGAAYLPIDPSTPAEKMNYMLEDSGVQLLIADTSCLPEQFIETEIQLIVLSELLLKGTQPENPQIRFTERDMAYMIYTSGSTGKPKGVMIEHLSLHNFILGITDRISFDPGDSIVSVTSISFDIFVLESLLPLSQGLRIIIADEVSQIDPVKLDDLIIREKGKWLQTTPSRLQMLLGSVHKPSFLASLKGLLIGGELLPATLIQELRMLTRARIYNMYGPTETTVWSSVQEVTSPGAAGLGTPIANTVFYVLDSQGGLVPMGAAGELYIGGDGLARGYWNRPELTEERFVSLPVHPGGLLYKTGDLVRWDGGHLQFLGRTDFQVKIRGYRIEPGEIEHRMLTLPGIYHCVVVAKGTAEEHAQYLVAYYTSDQVWSVDSLRAELSRYLPEYMIPSYFVQLQELPLTTSGKIDRNALPAPDTQRPLLAEAFAESGTPTQSLLIQEWRELLNKDIIGIHDNFFDLGGNSMLAVMLHSRLEAHYPGKLNVADIFVSPTVAGLAEWIDKATGERRELQLALLDFPDNLSVTDYDSSGEGWSFEIGGTDFESLSRFAAQQRSTISDLGLSAYLYVLSSLSAQSEVTIQLLPEEGSGVIPFTVELEGLSGFHELIERVAIQRQEGSRGESYPIAWLTDMIITKATNQIIPAYSLREWAYGDYGHVMDFVVTAHIAPAGDRISFHADYQADRLARDTAEKWTSLFMKTLEWIIQTEGGGFNA
ncbi:amino acid adenylation domain-containing protein [Paenibacillus sp. sgz5001063]|uniref:non-ribosomal peptide synthetase n=1 Tax=Paenibacillus sp. sgz5001063 TaxID=3242474 RepID=UPI0036D2D868